METITFKNFDSWESGRVITSFPAVIEDENGIGRWITDMIVFKRNPYGSHNFVLVSRDEAIQHGNEAVFEHIDLTNGWWIPAGKKKRREKARRKALRFLAERRK